MDKKIIDLVKARLNESETFGTGENNHNLWLDMYRDESPWLSAITLSMGIPASIASELARLTTIELISQITDDPELDVDYQNIINETRIFTEQGLALGGIILKPYISGERVLVDYITPDRFIVISFDDKTMEHIVFIDEYKDGPNYFRRLEEHDLTGEEYVINNAVFKSKRPKELGDEVELSAVEKWSTLEPAVSMAEVGRPLFSYFKNPQANNLDLRSPLGVSCYSRATSLIQDADEQYSRFIWENEGGELAIDADITALKGSDDLPAGKERLFRNLGLDQKDGFYEVFSPTLRNEALLLGLNKILMRIEFLCGLAYGTISDVQYTTKTAEEIKSSKQRSYSTVVDIQKVLQESLTDTVEAMIILRSLYLDKGVKEPKISFEFDDSLIVDTKSEQAIRMQEVAAGLLKREEYIMWRYGITEEEAKKRLPNLSPPQGEYDDIE